MSGIDGGQWTRAYLLLAAPSAGQSHRLESYVRVAQGSLERVYGAVVLTLPVSASDERTFLTEASRAARHVSAVGFAVVHVDHDRSRISRIAHGMEQAAAHDPARSGGSGGNSRSGESSAARRGCLRWLRMFMRH